MKIILTFLTAGFICFISEASANECASQNNDKAIKASENLMSSLKIESPAANEISSLLLNEKFLEFEKLSREYEEKFIADPRYESPLTKIYTSIDAHDGQLFDKLDAFVRLRPSYISYSARGMYKVARGYSARGTKSIGKTPAANITEMQRLLGEAKIDFSLALKENKKHIPTYLGLLRISMVGGNYSDEKEIVDMAAHEVPTSYYIKQQYLVGLQPRWGGSYEAMDNYASTIDDQATKNPRIWSLKGESFADRGYTAYMERNYQDAIINYTKALSYGDRLQFFEWRGNVYWQTKQFALALADFNHIVEYEPENKRIIEIINEIKYERNNSAQSR